MSGLVEIAAVLDFLEQEQLDSYVEAVHRLRARIGALERALEAIVRIDADYDIEMYLESFDDSIADFHIWRQTMEEARTFLAELRTATDTASQGKGGE